MKMSNIVAESTKKKILLISYHFPPSSAIGGLRAVNFAKHLPSFGWIPHVLTADDHSLDTSDWERLKEVERIRTIKAGQLLTLRETYILLKRKYGEILKRNLIPKKKSEMPDSSFNVSPSNAEKLLQKIKRYFSSLFFTLPDTEKGWIIPAVLKAIREIRKENIDYVLTSSPPYSVLIIGILVKMITGIKWVADFRDPWMTAGTKIYPTCTLSNKIESWLERKVIQKADLVVFNVQRLRDAYKRKYATEPVDKFVHIPNGIDQERFFRKRSLKKYEKFTLSYTGSLFENRSPEPVFKALNQLVHEGKTRLDEFNVKLVGACRYVGSYSIFPIIQAYGLDKVVEVIDPVSSTKALGIIRQSHLALLFAANQPFQIPGKVYEYIGTGTKILAIAEESATSDLIRSTHCGRVFHPSDIEGIKEFIFKTMASEPSIEENHCMVMSQFDAKQITKSLANNLNRIVV
jgi:glycosyltransferase involved in cell wall biosynthesis